MPITFFTYIFKFILKLFKIVLNVFLIYFNILNNFGCTSNLIISKF